MDLSHIYLAVNVKTVRTIAQIFVAFSEKLNFKVSYKTVTSLPKLIVLTRHFPFNIFYLFLKCEWFLGIIFKFLISRFCWWIEKLLSLEQKKAKVLSWIFHSLSDKKTLLLVPDGCLDTAFWPFFDTFQVRTTEKSNQAIFYS